MVDAARFDPADGSYATIPAGRSPHGIWLNTHDQLTARLPMNRESTAP